MMTARARARPCSPRAAVTHKAHEALRLVSRQRIWRPQKGGEVALLQRACQLPAAQLLKRRQPRAGCRRHRRRARNLRLDNRPKHLDEVGKGQACSCALGGQEGGEAGQKAGVLLAVKRAARAFATTLAATEVGAHTHRPGRCARRWRAKRRAAREGVRGVRGGSGDTQTLALCTQKMLPRERGAARATRSARARPTRAGRERALSRTCIAVGAWPRLRTAAQNSAVVSRPS